MYGAPMTLADYDESRWIVEPLHLFDLLPVSNGAVAVIVTSANEGGRVCEEDARRGSASTPSAGSNAAPPGSSARTRNAAADTVAGLLDDLARGRLADPSSGGGDAVEAWLRARVPAWSRGSAGTRSTSTSAPSAPRRTARAASSSGVPEMLAVVGQRTGASL